MKKGKNQELNFLYLEDNADKNEVKKKKESKKKQVKKKETSKKKKNQHQDNNRFDFDNEIVIGVTKLPNETKKKNIAKSKKKNNQRSSKNVKKAKKIKGADKKSAPRNIAKSVQKESTKTKKKSFIKWFIKWTILLGALIAAIIFFMTSPLFNVIEVSVIGNNAISEETIISLSEIQIGDNIYKTSKSKIKQRVKQNSYIESVEVKRMLPNRIELTVKERHTTFMLEYANSFVYINNQGYILEISDRSLNLPIIEGYTTPQGELKEGNRLNIEDLERLEKVLRIIESTEANGIISKINRINIENEQNYILRLEEDKKTVYLGDASNLSTRMLYLKAALSDTKGLEGEIFVNGDLVKEKAFFRQKQ